MLQWRTEVGGLRVQTFLERVNHQVIQKPKFL